MKLKSEKVDYLQVERSEDGIVILNKDKQVASVSSKEGPYWTYDVLKASENNGKLDFFSQSPPFILQKEGVRKLARDLSTLFPAKEKSTEKIKKLTPYSLIPFFLGALFSLAFTTPKWIVLGSVISICLFSIFNFYCHSLLGQKGWVDYKTSTILILVTYFQATLVFFMGYSVMWGIVAFLSPPCLITAIYFITTSKQERIHINKELEKK